MISRQQVEQERNSIRSVFNVSIDYDETEQEIMRDYQCGVIDYNEFEERLELIYRDIENEQKEVE